ncbi:MAG: Rrf2 family transcriptional regulator, partial [Oscillospiraceae bacterium]|nr:Rrf2 family transcriptional regulator [Candidatus Equicaccousia limihippi]
MLLSKETDYAIRIVSCLSKTDRHLSAAEISAKTGVTKNFALKILHNLSVAGIVNGIKGKNGGYFLNKPPKDITLLEII